MKIVNLTKNPIKLRANNEVIVFNPSKQLSFIEMIKIGQEVIDFSDRELEVSIFESQCNLPKPIDDVLFLTERKVAEYWAGERDDLIFAYEFDKTTEQYSKLGRFEE